MKLSKIFPISVSVFIIFCSLFSQGYCVESTPVTRAAFDLGSGKFKMVVADVTGNQVNVKFSKTISVSLGDDFASSSDGMLSEKIQKEALKALCLLKQEAEKHNAEQFCGITTAVFRLAKNGPELLEKLKDETGINIHLISQEKEGELGFNTAVVLSPELNEENIVSWDSGNASFQITTKENEKYLVYEGPVGNALIRKMFLEEVRHTANTKEAALNPISLSECKELAHIIKQRISPPDWLEQKLSDPTAQVIGIGDNGVIFAMAAKGLRTLEYSADQVEQLIERLAGSSDDELRKYRPNDPETVMTRLVLLHAVMEKFDIKNVKFKESTGSTLGLLIDSSMWD